MPSVPRFRQLLEVSDWKVLASTLPCCAELGGRPTAVISMTCSTKSRGRSLSAPRSPGRRDLIGVVCNATPASYGGSCKGLGRALYLFGLLMWFGVL